MRVERVFVLIFLILIAEIVFPQTPQKYRFTVVPQAYQEISLDISFLASPSSLSIYHENYSSGLKREASAYLQANKNSLRIFNLYEGMRVFIDGAEYQKRTPEVKIELNKTYRIKFLFTKHKDCVSFIFDHYNTNTGNFSSVAGEETCSKIQESAKVCLKNISDWRKEKIFPVGLVYLCKEANCKYLDTKDLEVRAALKNFDLVADFTAFQLNLLERRNQDQYNGLYINATDIFMGELSNGKKINNFTTFAEIKDETLHSIKDVRYNDLKYLAAILKNINNANKCFIPQQPQLHY